MKPWQGFRIRGQAKPSFHVGNLGMVHDSWLLCFQTSLIFRGDVSNIDFPVSPENQCGRSKVGTQIWVCNEQAWWFFYAGNVESVGPGFRVNEMRWCMYQAPGPERPFINVVLPLFSHLHQGAFSLSFLYYCLLVLRRQAPVSNGKIPELYHREYGPGWAGRGHLGGDSW